MKIIFLLFSLFLSFIAAEKIDYTDYSLYKLTPKDELSVQKLKFVQRNLKGYDFWTPIKTVGVPVDILVPPELKSEFFTIVESLNVKYEVKMDNIQEFIDKSYEKKRPEDKNISWDAYYTIDEINQWLGTLAQANPDKVSIITAGATYEGRNITGVKISFNTDKAKRGVFIEANIHAREWITNAVATYILNEVLTSTDDDFRKLVESFDWYIVPVTNPDGYAYTHTNDRMWRKTRVPYEDCYGADPNRNWGYHWNDGEAADNPCSETYPGPKAFSEPETKSLSEYLDTIGENLGVYISFHSYSQLLMVPYGYTEKHLDNYNVTVPVGKKAAEALAKRYGTEYQVGNIVETIYVAPGNSLDWVKGIHHVPYTYVYELRDEGTYGFLLPPELIVPTALETLDSVVVILQAALDNPDGKSL